MAGPGRLLAPNLPSPLGEKPAAATSQLLYTHIYTILIYCYIPPNISNVSSGEVYSLVNMFLVQLFTISSVELQCGHTVCSLS